MDEKIEYFFRNDEGNIVIGFKLDSLNSANEFAKMANDYICTKHYLTIAKFLKMVNKFKEKVASIYVTDEYYFHDKEPININGKKYINYKKYVEIDKKNYKRYGWYSLNSFKVQLLDSNYSFVTFDYLMNLTDIIQRERRLSYWMV